MIIKEGGSNDEKQFPQIVIESSSQKDTKSNKGSSHNEIQKSTKSTRSVKSKASKLAGSRLSDKENDEFNKSVISDEDKANNY